MLLIDWLGARSRAARVRDAGRPGHAERAALWNRSISLGRRFETAQPAEVTSSLSLPEFVHGLGSYIGKPSYDTLPSGSSPPRAVSVSCKVGLGAGRRNTPHAADRRDRRDGGRLAGVRCCASCAPDGSGVTRWQAARPIRFGGHPDCTRRTWTWSVTGTIHGHSTWSVTKSADIGASAHRGVVYET